LAAPYQVFNVVDDLPVRKAEVVAWLAERLGLPVPGFSGAAVPGRRPDPPDRAVSNAKIKEELGWFPRFGDFRAGYEAILGA
jgi:nucleoside-diphosphate-sugar epimerase